MTKILSTHEAAQKVDIKYQTMYRRLQRKGIKPHRQTGDRFFWTVAQIKTVLRPGERLD